jgi:GTP diphosphokinase / guanosine-3',5'-bis(diphosphate) 3'-diphosphatase
MRVLIGASIIVGGAFALAAIKEFVDSLPLAVALEILFFAVAVGIFVWLR